MEIKDNKMPLEAKPLFDHIKSKYMEFKVERPKNSEHGDFSVNVTDFSQGVNLLAALKNVIDHTPTEALQQFFALPVEEQLKELKGAVRVFLMKK